MPLAHHVSLVVEPAGHRDVGDATAGAQEHPAGMLEPKNPGGRLRSDAELGHEALPEVSPTETGIARELMNGPASITDVPCIQERGIAGAKRYLFCSTKADAEAALAAHCRMYPSRHERSSP